MVAKAVVPLQFVEVMFMFFLERMVVEECSCKNVVKRACELGMEQALGKLSLAEVAEGAWPVDFPG